MALISVSLTDSWLLALGIVRSAATNFILLWIGCFVGVWLSYGIRTATLTLDDLVTTDSDRLLPHVRLIFSGALTMVLGLLFSMGIVEVKIGSYAITKITENAGLAFIVGTFCGISEAQLPGTTYRRASAMIADVR